MVVRLVLVLAREVAGYMREMDRGLAVMHSQEALLARPDRESQADGSRGTAAATDEEPCLSNGLAQPDPLEHPTVLSNARNGGRPALRRK